MDNQNTPLVTVAMVTYNSAKYLRMAIESVLASSYSNFELIISDDCSSDNTWEIIKKYEDTRIRAYRNNANLGEYQNRNVCINLAKGQYLIFIDGEDYLYSDGLEYLTKTIIPFSDEEICMVIGRGWDENIIYPYLVDKKSFILASYIGSKSLLALNFTRILFNTKLLKVSSRFNYKYRIGDFYIQHLLGKSNNVLIVKEGFGWWRRTAGQASESILKNGQESAESYNILSNLLNEPDCPLSEVEKKNCSQSINRDLGRLLLRKLLKLNISNFIKLMRISNYPFTGFFSSFSKSKRNIIFTNLNEPLQ